MTDVEAAADVARRVARLEEIAGRDPGGRGIAPLLAATRGDLLGAAESVARHPASHVAIVTGFYIPAADPPAAENDGPVGAAHLAAALERVGVPSRLVTDAPCAGAVTAAGRAAGHSGGVDVVGLEKDRTQDDIASVLDAWDVADPPVSHVVAIERVGLAADFTCRNMKGDDISAWNMPLDRFFAGGSGGGNVVEGRRRVRIGIGDGGNEIGMGKLPRELVAASVPRGGLVGCVTDCDYLLVCGVSNWGALALVAALALVRPGWSAALTAGFDEEHDRRVLEATIHEGPAVDGMLRRPALSVDNLSPEVNAAVLRDLAEVLT